MKKLSVNVCMLLLCVATYGATQEEIAIMPKGSDCNAALVSFYSNSTTNSALSKKFNPALATRAQCLSFYELVLKNTDMDTNNVADLSWIKGQLLKLSY